MPWGKRALSIMVSRFQVHIWAGLLAGMVAFGPSPASSQSALLEPVAGSFNERLMDRVPTSGRMLVGLHLGIPSGRFDPGQIVLPARSQADGGSICLRLATRDGRYRAIANYQLPAGVAGERTLSLPTRVGEQLKTMAANDFAVNSVVAAQCDEAADGLLVPVRLPGARGNDVLTVAVNAADGTVAARLLSADGKSLTGSAVRCVPPGPDHRIVFSHLCSLPLGASVPAGRAVLEVTIIELTDGRSIRRYDIELPQR